MLLSEGSGEFMFWYWFCVWGAGWALLAYLCREGDMEREREERAGERERERKREIRIIILEGTVGEVSSTAAEYGAEQRL